jgi:hypothetical protein
MAQKIATIFNCGTSFDRDSVGETIGELFKDALGFDLDDWDGERASIAGKTQFKLVTDGPGSRARHRASSGSFVRRLVRRAAEIGLGIGMDETMWATVETLRLLHSQVPLDRIIMTGWSRGGIMCHYIANGLQDDEVLRTIPVTIVAIDPVPGPGNAHLSPYYQIPPNVTSYFAFLMENENMAVMDPIKVQVKDKQRTDKQILLMPGLHQDGVLDRANVHGVPLFRDGQRTIRAPRWMRSRVYDGLQAVHIMIEYLTSWILHSHGTKFNADRVDRIEQLFDDRVEQLALYSDMVIYTKKLFRRGTELRTKVNGFDNYVAVRNHLLIGAGYFINELHQSAFAAEYPQIHHAFFVDERGERRFRRLMKRLHVHADEKPRRDDASRAAARIRIEDLYRAVTELEINPAVMVELRSMSRPRHGTLEIYDSLTRFRYWTGHFSDLADDAFYGADPALTSKFESYPYASFHKRSGTAERFVPWRA